MMYEVDKSPLEALRIYSIIFYMWRERDRERSNDKAKRVKL